MLTSWHGHIFRITGPFLWETHGQLWILLKMSQQGANHVFSLLLAVEQTIYCGWLSRQVRSYRIVDTRNDGKVDVDKHIEAGT